MAWIEVYGGQMSLAFKLAILSFYLGTGLQMLHGVA